MLYLRTEDDTIEGILWLRFVSKCKKAELHTCVCYLPPHESSRNIDADDFFDNLICQMHQYCKNEMFFIIYKVMKYRKILMKYYILYEYITLYIFTPPECTYNFFGLPLTFPLAYCSALQNFKRL